MNRYNLENVTFGGAAGQVTPRKVTMQQVRDAVELNLKLIKSWPAWKREAFRLRPSPPQAVRSGYEKGVDMTRYDCVDIFSCDEQWRGVMKVSSDGCWVRYCAAAERIRELGDEIERLRATLKRIQRIAVTGDRP